MRQRSDRACAGRFLVPDRDGGLQRIDPAAQLSVVVDEDRLRTREPRGHQRLLFHLDLVPETLELLADALRDARIDEQTLTLIVDARAIHRVLRPVAEV